MISANRLVYAGTPDFAVPALQMLLESGYNVVAVYTQPDRPAGRGRRLASSPVKQLVEKMEHGSIPAIEQPDSLKSPEAQQHLASYAPDLMIVAAYGLILPAPVLSIPRLGCVNLHASLLPRWRGAAPIQRAILAGDRQTGITLMQMDKGLDTGDMLATQVLDIDPEQNAQVLHDRLAETGADLLKKNLPALLAGQLPVVPQAEQDATYAQKLDKKEAWLDWHKPAVDLLRQVLAFNPWPVAQCRWGDKVMRVWQAALLKDVPSAEPGQVLAAGRDGIDVATGSGGLRIQQLQLPGGKVLNAADFVNANDLTGCRLG